MKNNFRFVFTGLILVFMSLTLFPQTQIIDSLNFEKSEGFYFVDSSYTNILPFRNVGELILNNPNSYYLKGERYFSDGLETGNGSIFIDGMQVQDGIVFLYRSISKYQHYRLNQPIEYGNIPGSVTEIKTQSFKDSLHIEADFLSSLEKDYDNILFEILVGGPISFRQKNSREWKKRPSFLFSASVNTTNDYNPSWEPKYNSTPDYLEYIQEFPLRPADEDWNTPDYNTEFTRLRNLNSVSVHQNAERKTRNLYGKLEFPIKNNMDLAVGSYFKYDEGDEFIFENALYNSYNNPKTTQRNIDNFISFNHKFYETVDLKMNYQVFFQYSDYYFNREIEKFEDRWFEYGYLGKYTTYKTKSYELGSVEIDGVVYDNVLLMNSMDYDTAVLFEDLGYNPYLARFTEMVYELFPDKSGRWENISQIRLNGGNINGDTPNYIYDLWSSQGNILQRGNYFGEQKEQNYRGSFVFRLNYKKHNIKLGLDYSNKFERLWAIGPTGLWKRMRYLLNFHIQELDLDNPIPVYNPDGSFSGKVDYYRFYNGDTQFDLDKNLRGKLGLPVDGLDYILIDSYDMVNNTIDYYDENGQMHTITTPENLLSIDLFSPDLITNNTMNAKGYDIYGKKIKSSNNPYRFFDDWSTNPFNPIYSSVFVEDDFAYGNFSARLGAKFDYYDANQPVMTDKYTLYDAYTAGEAYNSAGNPYDHPENIGNDYMVYVNDAYNPTKIMGYRDGDNWYDAGGVAILDPEELNAGNGINPYLKYPNVNIGGENWQPENSFTDYKPVWSFLPQVNLNYNIWKMNVYANLNSFSKNPYYLNQFRPENYLMMNSTIFQQNPDLDPYRVYKLNFGADYNIFRNYYVDISYQGMRVENYYVLDRLIGGFPISYNTIVNYNENIDVHSFSAAFVILPDKPSGFNASVSSTYSFIDDKYRSILNISDLVLNSTIGYNFGYGRDFLLSQNNILKAIFEGFNIALFYQNRAGTFLPRTIYAEQNYDYSPNFSFTNLRVEKGFYIKPAELYLSAYLFIENLFNQKNVFYIDPTTGAVDDDGYLSASENQNEINDQPDPESYRIQYQAKLYNPEYYAKPRIIRGGLIVKF